MNLPESRDLALYVMSSYRDFLKEEIESIESYFIEMSAFLQGR